MDSLTCQWANCGERCTSPETLYDHVCERHVGRKSTNNLNLQCQWGNCRTTTVKRDHITSHIRVHVPLKPHKCEFCGKSFKRPQDLKKHVKTHADESVLLNPETGSTTRIHGTQPNGYGQQNSKPAPNGYSYSMAPNGHYGYHTGGPGHHYSGAGIPMGQQNYGQVFYNMPQAANYANGGLTESRMREHNALNEWIGVAKRRQMDPNQFQDLAARFGDWQSFNMPVQNGPMFANMYEEQSHGPQVAYQTQAPMSQFSELKTRNDLLSLDQFLEQLQNTMAEAPIGAQQPLHMPMAHHSPQQQGYPSSPSTSTQDNSTPGTYGTPTMEDVPALTPSSFHTSHSRDGSTSAASFNRSPSSQPAQATLYPSLPSFSTLADHNNEPQLPYGSNPNLVHPTTSAPISAYGNAYESLDDMRRRPGSRLQHSAPQRPSPPSESRRSSSGSGGSANDIARGIQKFEITSPTTTTNSPKANATKLPSIAAITRASASPERAPAKAASSSSSAGSASASPKMSAAELRKDANLRFVRAMRDYIRSRLQRGDFSETSSPARDRSATPKPQQQQQQQPQSLPQRQRSPPVDPAVTDNDGDRPMGGTEDKKSPSSTLYPVLRGVEV